MEEKYLLKETKSGISILVSQDVIDWLEAHDLENNDGRHRYIVNSVSYDNMGKYLIGIDPAK